MMHELQHHFLQFAFRHLSVPYDNAGFRGQCLQFRRNLPNTVHAVMHEVHLPTALQFLLERRLNQFLIPVRDHGLNRHAIFRRRLNHAHIAQPGQRHVQRARNRRGGHGQHVHLLAHLFQPLFVPNAKALFLVHNQQSQIGELDVLRKNAMGADQNVDLPGFRLLQNFLLLFRAAEAADHLDRDRERRKALPESFIVLEGEYCGGRKHRDLLVVADGLEGRAHGDLRLAITHVAAQQTIHGTPGLHVGFHVHDSLRLVFRFGEFESVFEFFHPLCIGGKCVALRHLALRIQPQQFVGHVFHGLADARFRLGPALESGFLSNYSRLRPSDISGSGRAA